MSISIAAVASPLQFEDNHMASEDGLGNDICVFIRRGVHVGHWDDDYPLVGGIGRAFSAGRNRNSPGDHGKQESDAKEPGVPMLREKL
jgi:hypothetical protein